MKNLRIILMSIMTMFMIIGNVNSQELIYEKLAIDMDTSDFKGSNEFVEFHDKENGLQLNWISIKFIGYGTVVTFSGELDGKNFENYDNVNMTFELDNSRSNVDVSEELSGELFKGENGEFTIEFTFHLSDIYQIRYMVIDKIELYGTPNGNSVGLTKNDISNDFNVYTYNNNLIVKTDDYNTQYEVSVHNMNGQMVMNEKNNGQMETYLQVPNGIYIINLITKKGRLTKKVSIR